MTRKRLWIIAALAVTAVSCSESGNTREGTAADTTTLTGAGNNYQLDADTATAVDGDGMPGAERVPPGTDSQSPARRDAAEPTDRKPDTVP
ncbi:MAG TPA: hypothetical protein VHK69_19065 [Chitinophagaceae bacterium]|jgi:hypothetical protein|nr:hypothetical protein [Chitinophagaceae bacterium]